MWRKLRFVMFAMAVVALPLLLVNGCAEKLPTEGEEAVGSVDLSDPFDPEQPWELPGAITQDWGHIDPPINPWLPLRGYPFGRWVSGRGYHLGDDCVRSSGTPVYAIWHGRVKYARYNSGGWGYLMIVEYYINNLPFCVVYGHLGHSMFPGEGNWVNKGQYIGTVGSTQESGQSTPHLHLGIHYGGYGRPTGQYPPWCRGYASSTSGWFNPTNFMNYW